MKCEHCLNSQERFGCYPSYQRNWQTGDEYLAFWNCHCPADDDRFADALHALGKLGLALDKQKKR